MALRINIQNFEGPFDLLLHLVSRQKLDIGDLNLSDAVDQYIAYLDKMRRLDMEIASDFLLVASTLLEIKAASLCDMQEDDDDELEQLHELPLEESRRILIDRLIYYKQFKNAAAFIEDTLSSRTPLIVRDSGLDDALREQVPLYVRGLSCERLQKVFLSCVARRQLSLLDNEHIAQKNIPVQQCAIRVLEQLKVHQRQSFHELCPQTSPSNEKVAYFLALLLLFKARIIRLSQGNACELFISMNDTSCADYSMATPLFQSELFA